MHVRPLRPFGVEISGIDCGGEAFDPGELAVILARARVAVFRDQRLDDAGLVRFLERFGPLTFTQGEVLVPGQPMLNRVTNAGRATPPRSVFHTDTSYVARPPALTALSPRRLPRAGGATLFSDQVGAAARLPARLRRCLDGRRVLHRASGLEGVADEAWHPLFRRHPLTGEVALYLSTPERCTAIEGVGPEVGRRLIALLYRASTRARALYRHAWREGDLLMWDNRVTMHRADHDGVAGERTLHRGMVAGEAPITA